MKVKLIVSRAGGRISQSPGDVVEVSDAEGKRMIEAGHAVAVSGKETATKKGSPQKAVKE